MSRNVPHCAPFLSVWEYRRFEFLEFYFVAYWYVAISAVRDAEIEVYWVSKKENFWLLKELLQNMTYDYNWKECQSEAFCRIR
jgi:hypothetical protein